MTGQMPTDVLAAAIAELVAERLRPDLTAKVAELLLPQDHDVLSGAEQIAGWLGVSDRFVRDHEESLPVRRVGARLFASKSALAVWMKEDSK